MLYDLRHAFRSLRRSRGFAAAVIATLAIGIGANATMFALVDRLMLSPPPRLRDAGSLVNVGIEFGSGAEKFTVTTVSYPAFEDLRSRVPGFASVAAMQTAPVVLGVGADARSLVGGKVSGSYFSLLGPPGFIGRYIGETDDMGSTGVPVAVLSYACWRREFGADRDIVGRSITLDGTRYSVVGVAAPDFNGVEVEPVDVWVPLHAGMIGQTNWQSERRLHIVSVVARLRPGSAEQRVRDEATLAYRGGDAGSVGTDSTARITLQSVVPGISSAAQSMQSRISLWLAAMSAIVFLVALLNVANLVFVRAVQRRREIGVRLALGAGRWRIVRQLGVESILLAGAGGGLALLLSGWASQLVRHLLLPRMSDSTTLITGPILGVTLVASLIAIVVIGLFPALRASRASLVADLKEGGGTIGHGRTRLLNGLLSVQGTLATLLLVGAGSFVLSLYRVRHQDLGFSTDHVLYATMNFARDVPGSVTDLRYREAEAQLRTIPGVQSISLAQVVPFEGGFNVPPISVPGREDFPLPNQQLPALAAATPDFFAVLGMKLLAGRNFTPSDDAISQLVVIVNSAMASGLWPGQSAIGKCIRIGYGDEGPTGPVASPAMPCRQVVGVVNTARRRSIREEPLAQARMQYYVPFGQLPKPPAFVHDAMGEIRGLLIRTSGREDLAAAIRRRMQSFTANLPYADVRPLQSFLDRQMEPWVLGASMFTLFGVIVALLSALGLYSVRAYSVAQRQREFGVRLAIGAQSADILRLVVLEGLRVFGIGVACGLIGVLIGASRIEPLLFEVSPRDPWILIVVVGLLMLTGLAANAIPAMVAARTPLAHALRSD